QPPAPPGCRRTRGLGRTAGKAVRPPRPPLRTGRAPGSWPGHLSFLSLTDGISTRIAMANKKGRGSRLRGPRPRGEPVGLGGRSDRSPSRWHPASAVGGANRGGAELPIERASHGRNPSREWQNTSLDGVRGHTGPLDRHWAIHYSDRKSTRVNSSHVKISYPVFCLKKKTT